MMGDDERSIDDQLGAAGEELVGSSNVAEDDGGRSVASDDDLWEQDGYKIVVWNLTAFIVYCYSNIINESLVRQWE